MMCPLAAIGGAIVTRDSIYRDCEVFEPAANDWYRPPPMPTARHGVNKTILEAGD